MKEQINFIVINRTKEKSSVSIVDVSVEGTDKIKKKMIINLNVNDDITIEIAFQEAIDFDLQNFKRQIEIVK